MEENKELQSEKKKTAKKETTTKKATRKTPTTKGTTKKTTTKKSTGTAKKEAGTAKKMVSETSKKKTIEPKQTTVNDSKEEKLEIKEKTIPVKEERIELSKQEELVEKTETTNGQPKVEVKQETEQPKFNPAPKLEKKKKKHTFLKAILILIAITLALFLIHFERNYIIVDKILAKQQDLKGLTNYSYTTKYPEQKTTMEYYHKDDKMMLVRSTDTSKALIWSSLNSQETIFLNMKELTATVQKDVTLETFFTLLPRGIILSSEASRVSDFLYWITSEKVDGKDCYKVKMIFDEETAWYDKENGTLVKSTGSWYKKDGKPAEAIEYTDWKFNELTDEDMARPNLMGYRILNNKTEE